MTQPKTIAEAYADAAAEVRAMADFSCGCDPIHCRCRLDRETFGLAADRILDRAAEVDAEPAMAGVRVKPLEWRQSSTTTFRHTGHPADPFDVTYLVWRIKADRPELWAWGKDGVGQEGMSGYIEHAKAAAQADYDARILAAIVPPAMPALDDVIAAREDKP